MGTVARKQTKTTTTTMAAVCLFGRLVVCLFFWGCENRGRLNGGGFEVKVFIFCFCICFFLYGYLLGSCGRFLSCVLLEINRGVELG